MADPAAVDFTLLQAGLPVDSPQRAFVEAQLDAGVSSVQIVGALAAGGGGGAGFDGAAPVHRENARDRLNNARDGLGGALNDIGSQFLRVPNPVSVGLDLGGGLLDNLGRPDFSRLRGGSDPVPLGPADTRTDGQRQLNEFNTRADAGAGGAGPADNEAMLILAQQLAEVGLRFRGFDAAGNIVAFDLGTGDLFTYGADTDGSLGPLLKEGLVGAPGSGGAGARVRPQFIGTDPRSGEALFDDGFGNITRGEKIGFRGVNPNAEFAESNRQFNVDFQKELLQNPRNALSAALFGGGQAGFGGGGAGGLSIDGLLGATDPVRAGFTQQADNLAASGAPQFAVDATRAAAPREAVGSVADLSRQAIPEGSIQRTILGGQTPDPDQFGFRGALPTVNTLNRLDSGQRDVLDVGLQAETGSSLDEVERQSREQFLSPRRRARGFSRASLG